MVPKSKNGYGWQILNRVFHDVVSCVRSANLLAKHVGSSSIQPEVSFAKVVSASAVMNGKGGGSCALVQNSGAVETSKNLHEQLRLTLCFPSLFPLLCQRRKLRVASVQMVCRKESPRLLMELICGNRL